MDQPTENPIYFNPDKDKLYIHNEREYWIRDWFTGHGVLTQIKHAWRPECLRFLAIDLEPLGRATNSVSFQDDLLFLQNLVHVVFVAKEPSEKAIEVVRELSRVPSVMGFTAYHMKNLGWMRPSSDWCHGLKSSDVPYSFLIRKSQLKECSLAIKRGNAFEIVKTFRCDR